MSGVTSLDEEFSVMGYRNFLPKEIQDVGPDAI
jgi:hypothetical protein